MEKTTSDKINELFSCADAVCFPHDKGLQQHDLDDGDAFNCYEGCIKHIIPSTPHYALLLPRGIVNAPILCTGWLRKIPIHNAKRIGIVFVWVEADLYIDFNRISLNKNYILEKMQEMKIISEYACQQIAFLRDEFRVDRQNPGVEIHLYIIEE